MPPVLTEKQYSPRKVADGARAKAEAALTDALAAGTLGVEYAFITCRPGMHIHIHRADGHSAFFATDVYSDRGE